MCPISVNGPIVHQGLDQGWRELRCWTARHPKKFDNTKDCPGRAVERNQERWSGGSTGHTHRSAEPCSAFRRKCRHDQLVRVTRATPGDSTARGWTIRRRSDRHGAVRAVHIFAPTHGSGTGAVFTRKNFLAELVAGCGSVERDCQTGPLVLKSVAGSAEDVQVARLVETSSE